MRIAEIPPKRFVWIGLAAAVFLLLLAVYYLQYAAADAVVDIDAGAGVEMTLNRQGRVLRVAAADSDGAKALYGVHPKHADRKAAVDAVIGSMVKNGYVPTENGGVLVTVRHKNERRAAQLCTAVAAEVSAALKAAAADVPVVSRTVAALPEAEAFAREHGISFGKAAFILRLCAKDAALEKTALAGMPFGEITALAAEKQIDIRDMAVYHATDGTAGSPTEPTGGTTDGSTAPPSVGELSPERAREIALAHANVSAADASYIHTKLDTEDGVTVYEIDFIANGMKYEYEIHAKTGAVLSYEQETAATGSSRTVPSGKTQPTAAVTAVTPEKAKEIALAHAGVSASSVAYIEVEADREDGVPVYEVEFCVGTSVYDYEISAVSGAVLQHSCTSHHHP